MKKLQSNEINMVFGGNTIGSTVSNIGCVTPEEQARLEAILFDRDQEPPAALGITVTNLSTGFGFFGAPVSKILGFRLQ